MYSESKHPGKQVWDQLGQGSLPVLCCSSSNVEVRDFFLCWEKSMHLLDLSTSSLGSACSLQPVAIGTSGYVFMD